MNSLGGALFMPEPDIRLPVVRGTMITIIIMIIIISKIIRRPCRKYYRQ